MKKRYILSTFIDSARIETQEILKKLKNTATISKNLFYKVIPQCTTKWI
jgi:hypothetical protein